MKADKIRELMTSARNELLERIRDSYTTQKGWNTASITVVNFEKLDRGRNKQLFDGTGAN